MANTLFTLDEMDPDRKMKKLRQVVRWYESFKSQKNGDLNPNRNVLRWAGKVSTGVFERISVGFKNGSTIYY